jgi:hypothetical protein
MSQNPERRAKMISLQKILFLMIMSSCALIFSCDNSEEAEDWQASCVSFVNRYDVQCESEYFESGGAPFDAQFEINEGVCSAGLHGWHSDEGCGTEYETFYICLGDTEVYSCETGDFPPENCIWEREALEDCMNQ